MENKETLQAYARELRLYNLTANLDRMIHEAQQSKPTYLEFITRVFAKEVECRRKRDFDRRLSAAHLPARHDLDDFDYNFSSGINRQQMKELTHIAASFSPFVKYFQQEVVLVPQSSQFGSCFG